MDDLSDIGIFEEAIFQKAAAHKWQKKVVSEVARAKVATESIAWYTVTTVKQGVIGSVKNLAFTPTSHPSSSVNSSFEKTFKILKERKSRKRLCRRKSLMFPLVEGTMSLTVLMREMAKFGRSSTPSSDAKIKGPKLIVLHPTDGQFQSEVNYKTFSLLDESRTYNEKNTACTSNYAKRMETLIKVCKFNYKGLVAKCCFLAQYKRGCDLNECFESVALCIIPTFIEDGPSSNLSVRMSPRRDEGTTHKWANDRRRADLYVLRSCKFLDKILCNEFQHCTRNISYSLFEKRL